MFSDKHVSFLLLRLGLILSKKLRGRNWRQNKIKLSGGVWLEILAHPSMWRGQMQWCSWFPETVFSMTFVTGTSSKPGVRLTIRFNYPGVWFQSPGCSEGESSGRACTSRLLLHTCHRFVLFLCSLEHQVCFLLHPCAYFLWKKKKKIGIRRSKKSPVLALCLVPPHCPSWPSPQVGAIPVHMLPWFQFAFSKRPNTLPSRAASAIMSCTQLSSPPSCWAVPLLYIWICDHFSVSL